jgi:hypothetical protein
MLWVDWMTRLLNGTGAVLEDEPAGGAAEPPRDGLSAAARPELGSAEAFLEEEA